MNDKKDSPENISDYLDSIDKRLEFIDLVELNFGDFIDFLPNYYDENQIDVESIAYLSSKFEEYALCSEPRIRKGVIKRALDSPIYIYKSKGILDTKSQSYRQGLLMVRIAVIMAKVDGDVGTNEIENIINFIRSMNYLSIMEKRALIAKSHYFLDTGQKFDERAREYVRIALNRDGLVEKLPELSKTASFMLIKVAKDIALADGYIEQSELKLLQDMYKSVGMSARSVKPDLEKYAASNYIDVKFWNGDNLIPENDLDEIDDILGDLLLDFDGF